MKLQRDWELDPQSFPFAANVKPHALVSLIQKGLLYNQVEAGLPRSTNNVRLHCVFASLDVDAAAIEAHFLILARVYRLPRHHKSPPRPCTLGRPLAA